MISLDTVYHLHDQEKYFKVKFSQLIRLQYWELDNQSWWNKELFLSYISLNLTNHRTKLHRCISKDIQMAKGNLQRCSPSLIITKMKIKTIMSYQLTPARTAIIKKSRDNKCWWECAEKGILVHSCWEGNVCSYYRKQHGNASKN